ncbi:hypothetical protein LINPERPRIM_LOCUS3129 [Linum perenne]
MVWQMYRNMNNFPPKVAKLWPPPSQREQGADDELNRLEDEKHESGSRHQLSIISDDNETNSSCTITRSSLPPPLLLEQVVDSQSSQVQDRRRSYVGRMTGDDEDATNHQAEPNCDLSLSFTTSPIMQHGEESRSFTGLISGEDRFGLKTQNMNYVNNKRVCEFLSLGRDNHMNLDLTI